MLKSTITILFVITIVAFSLVSANIFAASSNMNTAAYAAKKGHSSSSKDTSSGDKSSSKSEKSGSSGGSSTKSKGDDTGGGGSSGGGGSTTGSGSTSDSDKDRDSASKDTDVGTSADTGGTLLGTPSPGTNEHSKVSLHHTPRNEPQQGPYQILNCAVAPCPPVPPPPNPPPTKTCPDGSKPDAQGKCPPPTKTCPDGSKPDAQGKCVPQPPIYCLKGVFHQVGDHCVLNPNCHYDKDHSGNITCTIIIHGHTTTETHQSSTKSSSSSSNNIVVLPSKPNDFANRDPSTLTVDFVHATGPDTIGNYWVKGEIMNNQKSLQNLKITAHWFDSNNNIIGVTFSYADKLDLGFGDRSTFSVLADGHSDLTGIPKSVELSYDWR
jgi:hypothetical protein